MKRLMFAIMLVFCLGSIAAAGPIKYTVDGYPAAVYKSDLTRAIDLSIAKDSAALQQLIDQNRVIIMKGGIKVEVVDTKIFSGMVKIRPFGTNAELWTLIEGVD